MFSIKHFFNVNKSEVSVDILTFTKEILNSFMMETVII